jgi:hypothetical protein
MIENVHLNVKNQKQYVETIKQKIEKNVMIEMIIEQQIAKITVQQNVK